MAAKKTKKRKRPPPRPAEKPIPVLPPQPDSPLDDRMIRPDDLRRKAR